VSDADECDLLGTILGDPDRTMAESSVIRHLDHKAVALGDGDALAEWSRRIAPALDRHELPKRRLRDWSLFTAIAAGRPWSATDLVESSNWLQRKVAEHTGSPEALAVFAEQGRTNRVRTSARSRLNRRSEWRAEPIGRNSSSTTLDYCSPG
jgi:hypothetical protein